MDESFKMYVKSVLWYISEEWGDMEGFTSEELTEEAMHEYFVNAFRNQVCFPNAACGFVKKFFRHTHS